MEEINVGDTVFFTTLKVAKVWVSGNPGREAEHVGPFKFELFLKTNSTAKVV
jgi:hypothetical protein